MNRKKVSEKQCWGMMEREVQMKVQISMMMRQMLKSEDEVKVKTVQFDSTHMFEGEWYRTDYAKSRD